jgi:uncharacterized protein YdaU (DUF1376 family)
VDEFWLRDTEELMKKRVRKEATLEQVKKN